MLRYGETEVAACANTRILRAPRKQYTAGRRPITRRSAHIERTVACVRRFATSLQRTTPRKPVTTGQAVSPCGDTQHADNRFFQAFNNSLLIIAGTRTTPS